MPEHGRTGAEAVVSISGKGVARAAGKDERKGKTSAAEVCIAAKDIFNDGMVSTSEAALL